MCGIGLLSATWDWKQQSIIWGSEKTLTTDPRLTHCSACSALVSQDLTCRGQTMGTALTSSTQLAVVTVGMAAIMLPWRNCTQWSPRLLLVCLMGEQGELYNIYFQKQYRVCEQRFPLYCWWGYTVEAFVYPSGFPSSFPFSFTVLFSQRLAHLSV